jgi:hypothetical protein
MQGRRGLLQSHQDFPTYPQHAFRTPVAVSGTNIYTAWNNRNGVAIFFTKSNDGGKTFANTMVLSPTNSNLFYWLIISMWVGFSE